MRDHALGKQAIERLGHRQHALVLQGARDEPGVEQVQDRVLDPADILVDRQPLVGGRLVDRRRTVRVGEAREVPGRVHEGVERVSLALGLAATLGTGDEAPGRMVQQWVAGPVEGHVVGQHDRQLVGRGRNHTASLAVDDWDRRAPVALARDAPVAKAIDGGALALAHLLDLRDRRGLGLFDGQAVQEAGVEDLARAGEGFGADLERRGLGVRRQHNGQHGEGVLAREIEVALVVGGAAEDGAGAVVHEDEVGDPDRQGLFGIERVDNAQARIQPEFFCAFDVGFRGAALAALGDEGRDLGVARGQLIGQGMVRRDADKRSPEQGVRPGGVDLQAGLEAVRRAAGEVERELQSGRPTDPVFLHCPDLVRPALERFQPVDQVVGVVSDPQEPLGQLLLLDHRAGAPAAAVDDLFVGEHGHVDRVPVHRRLAAIHQAALEELQEPGLLLAIVFRVAGRELATPVDGEAEQLQLLAHRRDVVVGPALGVHAALHGGVLGRHAEGVPSHRMEHGMALRAAIASDDVAHSVVADVAHVDAPRRIGEHLEDIVLRTRVLVADAEYIRTSPGITPFGLHVLRIVAGH